MASSKRKDIIEFAAMLVLIANLKDLEVKKTSEGQASIIEG